MSLTPASGLSETCHFSWDTIPPIPWLMTHHHPHLLLLLLSLHPSLSPVSLSLPHPSFHNNACAYLQAGVLVDCCFILPPPAHHCHRVPLLPRLLSPKVVITTISSPQSSIDCCFDPWMRLMLPPILHCHCCRHSAKDNRVKADDGPHPCPCSRHRC